MVFVSCFVGRVQVIPTKCCYVPYCSSKVAPLNLRNSVTTYTQNIILISSFSNFFSFLLQYSKVSLLFYKVNCLLSEYKFPLLFTLLCQIKYEESEGTIQMQHMCSMDTHSYPDKNIFLNIQVDCRCVLSSRYSNAEDKYLTYRKLNYNYFNFLQLQ